ncbi:uncharacterized protein [Montipora foliosa]
MGLLESEIQGPSITSCMSANQASFLLSEMPSSPQEKNPLNGRLNPGTHNMTSYLSPNNASQMFSTLSDSWCQELEDLPNMRSFGTSSASEVDSGWQDDGDGLPCVQQEQVGLYCIYGTSHTEDGSLTRAADRITISQARSQDCDLDHPESTVQPAQIWTDSNRNSHTEDSSSTTATDRNTILSQDCDLNHSVVELIRPQSGPLKGEYLFVISLSEPLPSRVNSGKAEFCGVATVNLEKLGNQAFLGVVPRCPSPGIVQVNVMTQNGELLGITCFEYFDETTEMLKEIVRNPAKQADFFLKWSEVCKSVSDSSLQTKEQNLLRGLQSLVYTAAQTGAWQFIELIFSTSAGKIVFDSYKDRTPLPEEVARAYGYDDLANYLQDLTTRFSKEPLEFSLKEVHEIDWSELEAAAIAAQTQGCLTEEKSSDDSSENNSDTDYFADVETSIDSSELSRSTSEDDSSEPYSREKTEASAHQSIFSIFKGTFAENGTMEKIRQHIEGVKQKSRVLILEDSHFHFSLPEVVKGLNYTLAFQVATRSKNIPRHLHTANERFLGSRESIIRQPTISFCKLHPHPDVLIESSLVKNNNDHISRTVASKQSNQLNEDIPLEQFGVHRHFPLWVLTSAFRPKRKTLFVYFADRRDALPPNYFFEDEDCELQIRRWKWKRSEKKSVKKKKETPKARKLPLGGEKSQMESHADLRVTYPASMPGLPTSISGFLERRRMVERASMPVLPTSISGFLERRRMVEDHPRRDMILLNKITAAALAREMVRRCGNEGRQQYLDDSRKTTLRFLRAAISFIPEALDDGADMSNAAFFSMEPGCDFTIKAGHGDWEYCFSEDGLSSRSFRLVRAPLLRYCWVRSNTSMQSIRSGNLGSAKYIYELVLA